MSRPLSLLLSAILLPGCVMVYAPGAAAPGRLLPPEVGEVDVALGMDVARNVSDGVAVALDGTGAVDESLPIWPALDVGVRAGLTERLGAEARLTGSLILPLPFPVPSGLTLAPVLHVADLGPTVSLHTSPRGVLVSGGGMMAAWDQTTFESSAWGAEVPLELTWRPARAFALNVTPFGRVFRVTGRSTFTPDGGETQEGLPLSWWTTSFGATANLFLTLGFFRFSLGGGIEGAPHPGRSFDDGCAGEVATACVEPAPFLWYPQGGFSLGAVFGGPKG